MRFFYDSTGKRVGFANGTMLFYYLYNLQGGCYCHCPGRHGADRG